MKYISDEILFDDTGKKNAGSKARKDVISVAIDHGYQPVHIPWPALGNRNITNLLKLQSAGKRSWRTHTDFLNSGDVFVFQMPTVRYLFSIDQILRNLKRRGIRIVVFIHDLESLRYEKDPGRKKLNDILKKIENHCFGLADCIVVHNEKMSRYLTMIGYSSGITESSVFSIPRSFNLLNNACRIHS